MKTRAAITSKWFCAICWRNGEMEGDDMALARQDHRMDVRRGIAANDNPAGVDPSKVLHPEFFQKFRGVDCVGDIRIGERPSRPRFEQALAVDLNFPKEGIELK